jgi:hypothetical protein
MTAGFERAVRLYSLLLPRTRNSLRRALAQDRLLLTLTLVLLLAAWLPLCLTPFLPFADLPLNTASADLLWDTALGRAPAAQFYHVNWAPVPYWSSYLLACFVGRVVGPLIAAKVVTAIILALLPLGMMRLMLALERDPRLGLWAFGAVWSQNLYAGWLSLLMGFGLIFFVLAWLIEAESWRDGLRLVPYTALVAVTHVQATWLLGIAGVGLVFTRGFSLRRVATYAVALSGAATIIGAWVVGQLRGRPSGPAADFIVGWHSPAYKVAQFFNYTLDNFSRADAERTAVVTFVVLVLGPFALTQLPGRIVRDRLSPLVLVASAGLLYALLWWEISGPISHWYTYPRYAIVIVLWLSLIPSPNLRGLRALALAPGVLMALSLDVKVAEQFSGFAERTRPFLDIIARVPRHASVLAFVLDDSEPDPDLKVPPYHQLYAYITAVGHGYSPYLWTSPQNPLVYSLAAAKPAPGWSGAFSLDEQGSQYDYIVVQGFAKGDPVASATSTKGLRPKLVLQSARWRLYEVHPKASR